MPGPATGSDVRRERLSGVFTKNSKEKVQTLQGMRLLGEAPPPQESVCTPPPAAI